MGRNTGSCTNPTENFNARKNEWKEIENMGKLEILNVSEGDIKIVFDKNNPAETIRAKRYIKDMLRRGYALLIELEDGTHTRALDFDENKECYIIADFDASYQETSSTIDEILLGKSEEKTKEIKNEQIEAADAKEPTIKKTKQGRKSIPIQKANAVAVAPSAGG